MPSFISFHVARGHSPIAFTLILTLTLTLILTLTLTLIITLPLTLMLILALTLTLILALTLTLMLALALPRPILHPAPLSPPTRVSVRTCVCWWVGSKLR